MTIKFDTLLQNAIAEAIGALFDGGSLEMWSGTQPATTGDPAASDDVLIGTLSLPDPAFGDATTGTVENAQQWNGTCDNAGTIGWFRMKSTDSDPLIMDGSVTGVGGGGDIELEVTAYNVGDSIVVDPASFNQPAS